MFEPQKLRLTRRRTMTIRTATPDDVGALVALCEGLTPDDRHLRFFNQHHPRAADMQRWVSTCATKGLLLVAELRAGRKTPLIVADAGITALSQDEAELGMLVSRPWRGWLGPYLLDVLVEEAAKLGYANIQAEILVENRPMWALLRSRGAAVIEHPDNTTVRLAIGTHGRTPVFVSGDDQIRVLVEGTSRWWHEEAVHDAGFELLQCPGPLQRSAGAPCPVLAGGRCSLVDGADVIVAVVRQGDQLLPVVLEHHRSEPDGAPVLVEPLVGNGHDTDGKAVVRLLEERRRSALSRASDASTTGAAATATNAADQGGTA